MARSPTANQLSLKTVFVVCGGGLEEILTEELKTLGFSSFGTGIRGVYVDIQGIEDIYRINYCSRIATRVLLPLLNFRVADKESLYGAAASINWLKLVSPSETIAVDANVSNHRNLTHSLFAAMVVKDAVCDQLREATGKRPNVSIESPDLQINLFINGDRAVISLDTSGDPLHKRGYRMEGGEAPLQENLAAALLSLGGGFGPLQRLLDPCCGSGTLLIEAAWMATRTAPGILRKRWGFMQLPQYNQSEWLQFKEEIDSQRMSMPKGDIVGLELSQETTRICKQNLRAAGLHPYIDVICQDFRKYVPEQKFDVVCGNPPHGRRLGFDEVGLPGLYRDIGGLASRALRLGGRCWVFTTQDSLGRQVGQTPLVLQNKFSIKQGKDPGWLFAYNLI